MKLHKMVNGKKVMLSDEEEANVRKEWEENRKELEQKRQKHKSAVEKQGQLKQKLAKLMDVSVDDINLMLGKSNELFRN